MLAPFRKSSRTGHVQKLQLHILQHKYIMMQTYFLNLLRLFCLKYGPPLFRDGLESELIFWCLVSLKSFFGLGSNNSPTLGPCGTTQI